MVLEIVLKGIRKEVINVNKVDPAKLAIYIISVRNLGINDPIEDIGKHQLLRMMKASGVVTKAGNESIEGVAVLKKGSVSENWGWLKILAI
ncbi:MAG: hypothetical protein ACE5KT_08305 [Methanosarcinales archaeon]